jgi:hypothetical protein
MSTYAGNNGRKIMSVRNSRLGFDLTMPEMEGIKTEAILEMDFMGNQAANDTPGTSTAASVTGTSGSTKGAVTSVTGITQSERDFFNNPTERIRHAYLNMTIGSENAKIGQTWSLLGWQPYYFPSEPIVAPSVGQLYRRFPQVRITDTRTSSDLGLKDMTGDWTLETAVDAAKPGQMDSEITDFHGGIRISSNKCKAATGLGSGSSMVGLSLAASAVWIPVNSVSIGCQTGQGYALDALIPIIPSKDGKDMSNNLSLTAEYSRATGVGGLELAGATAGISAPSAAQLGTTSPLDSGIAGINALGRLELIDFQTARANLTYVLPNPKWAVSAGYAQVAPENLSDFTASTSYISKYVYGYAAVFYMPLKWLKFAGEYAEFKDTYTDPVNPDAQDNRIQFTTYVTF